MAAASSSSRLVARGLRSLSLSSSAPASMRTSGSSKLSSAAFSTARTLAAGTTTTTTTTTKTKTTTLNDVPRPPAAAPSVEGSAAPRAKPHERPEPLVMARSLLRWTWLESDSPRRAELITALDRSPSHLPSWLIPAYDAARTYRSARSRLWIPAEAADMTEYVSRQRWLEERIAERAKLIRAEAEEQAKAVQRRGKGSAESEEQAAELRRKGEKQASTWEGLEREEQLDYVLKPYWEALNPSQREEQLLRVRFECARRLGWRKGYSAGFPVAKKKQGGEDGEEAKARLELIKRSGQRGETGREAWKELMQREDDEAWSAWQALSSSARFAEERAAWELRDRSRIYVDDASTSLVLGSTGPRWYEVPQRAGPLTFLPVDTIRLVRNFVPKGAKYDAWKATFRVPLNMHKHAVRSYLLAIYGLRTTWARSMIYRSPISRTRLHGRKTTKGGDRTFKKVEVGLLEPFVFPEITQAFKREHMMEEDFKFETARIYLKASGHKRWRSTRPVDPMTPDPNSFAMEGNLFTRKYDGQSYITAPAKEEEEGGAGEGEGERKAVESKRPPILVRGGGVPTKRHSRILRMLGEKRESREREVEKRVREMETLDRDAEK